MATPMPAAATAVPAYGMTCSTPANTPHIPAFGRPEQRERPPCRERDQHVRDQQRHHVRLDLRVDLVQDFDGDPPPRERVPRELRDLAAKRIAGGQQEEREQDGDHDSGQRAPWRTAPRRRSGAAPPRCSGGGAAPGWLAGRFRRRAIELGRRRLDCVIGLAGARTRRGQAQLARRAGHLGDRGVHVVANHVADRQHSPRARHHQRRRRNARHVQALERRDERPQRIAQQDSRDHRNQKRLGDPSPRRSRRRPRHSVAISMR